MLIEILSTFHGILCFSIIAIIYFAKPDTSGLSTLSQNFNSNNNKKTIRFRPITKLIFTLVILFFLNSILLNKLISSKAKESSIINNISETKPAESEYNKYEGDIEKKTGEINP